jgi:hypothetical protein
MEQRGLVLCTGTTGSGKTTTLAAMVDHVNATRNEHIMTIEDPIEYLHRDKRSIVNQRELDVDTKGFSTALRSALRQDPRRHPRRRNARRRDDRDGPDRRETGHLVLSTLHTLDATETVNRIITVFPPHQHRQIRLQLGAVLKAVISLRLMPRADGLGRVPAVEVLVATDYVRECIENKEKTKYLKDAIKAGTSQYGMQSFDQSLYQLYKSGLITLEEAIKRATNPNEFRLKIQGIQSTSDVAFEEMDSALEGPRIYARSPARSLPSTSRGSLRAGTGRKRPTRDAGPKTPDPDSAAAARLRALQLLTCGRGGARSSSGRSRRRASPPDGARGGRAAGTRRLARRPRRRALGSSGRGGRYGRARIERSSSARGSSEERIAAALRRPAAERKKTPCRGCLRGFDRATAGARSAEAAAPHLESR